MTEPLDGVAIVGMSLRVPGAEDVATLWRNLCEGRECIRRFAPEELDALVPAALRARPEFVPARPVLDDAGRFDAAFFGIASREAVLIDPQQRILLELAWNALEDAAIDPARFAGTIGVFAGTSNNTYAPAMRAAAPELLHASGDFAAMVAAEKDYVATRIANRLDLNGPALSIHTACSTSLVAIAQAWFALRSYQCDAAIAGGASVIVPEHGGYLHVEGGMESADGHCRPFDARAGGTVFGSGAGLVVLKRLEDAIADGDPIHAVIRGVGINNDGGGKASFTAPSVVGQAQAIRMALAQAGVGARDIGYVEAHGTGTALGDPIEVAALTRAYRMDTDASGYCWLGSIKGNVGHLVAAAGVAGLAKAVLCLRHGRVPPTLHFSAPNPEIDFASSPFRVADRVAEWSGATPRRAAVSSFGVGGTNAHAVLEQAPDAPAGSPSPRSQLLVLSARDDAALAERAATLATQLAGEDAPTLADVSFTLARGRRAMASRAAVVARDAAEAVARLRALKAGAVAGTPRVVFVFPGQGSQHPGMARELAAESASFREHLDRCLDAAMAVLDFDLRALVMADPGDAERAALLAQTRYAQPALFCVEYALARWLGSLGIEPAAMIGHSVGEYVAAVLAGVFTPEQGIALVARRGELMQAQPRGAMLAVRASADVVAARLPPEVAISGYNADDLVVVAGPAAAIDAFAQALDGDGIGSTRLAVSHAFHSPSMDGALEPFRDAVAAVPRSAPRARVYSCVTGRPLEEGQALDPGYWARQIRAPVRFRDAVAAEIAEPGTLFVEVGPSQALTALVRRQRDANGAVARVVPVLGPAAKPGDAARSAVEALGALWSAGVALDWEAWFAGESRRRVHLPGYPFKRERHWFPVKAEAVATLEGGPAPPVRPDTAAPPARPDTAAPPKRPDTDAPHAPARSRRDALVDELRRVFADLSGLAPNSFDDAASFVELGLDSLQLTQATLELGRVFGVQLRFRRLMEDLDRVGAIATLLDAELPPDAFAPAAPVAGMPAEAAAPVEGNAIAAQL
ncbi:MAG TPA: beta-ketoacyl synthase N-terminal-like domain-containing protein, partial [Xanthomonadales bacterium]|nr:beta-ketoacyl synthase N-terminal-like domain-containing protein [Xanthomonadales bacterium]